MTEPPKPTESSVNKKAILIGILILLAGAGITFLIFVTEPAATREGASKETAMLVETATVEKGNFRPTVAATGTVVPSQDVRLSSRVTGEVVEVSKSFTPGGFAEKGETLVRIDPADYQNTLEQRKSALRQAEAELSVEMGMQNAAQKGYELLDKTLSPENEALVLRQPQLNTARARVEAARVAVKQAELDLERTRIKAPFDAHVLSRNANLGSQVSPGHDLGRLVGRATYWVEATIPQSKLQRLSFPGDKGDKANKGDQASKGDKGSEVILHNHSAWLPDQYRTGRLFRYIGALEDRTRMARVLVAVDDPLAREKPGRPALMIGSFMEVRIQAGELKDVVRLNRDYLRQNDRVWVMQDSLLEIREVDVAFTDDEYAYIRDGLMENDQVVATNLSTVVEGARLRRNSNKEKAETPSAGEDSQKLATEPLPGDTGQTGESPVPDSTSAGDNTASPGALE